MTTENLSLSEAADQLGDITELFTGKDEDDGEDEQEEAAQPDKSAKEADDEEEAGQADEESEDEDDEDDSDEDEEEDDDDDPLISWETKAGDKVEVTLSELKNGFMRTRDYTQKTQEAAEIRRKSEAAEAEYREKAAKLEESLTHWAINGPQEPDWVALAAQDPARYVQTRAQWDQYQAHASKAKAELQSLRAEAEKERISRAETALLEDFPQWRDPQVAAKDGAELIAAANEFGFSREEFAQYIVEEPRIAKVLLAAGKFQAMTKKPANIEKRVSKPGKTLRPGSKTTAKQSVSRKNQEARQRFKQAPTMENAIQALDGLNLF